MMDYISATAQGFPSACDLQQLGALSALAATLTIASTAQGISMDLFAPFFLVFAGQLFHRRCTMQKGGLFKGCFGYIRFFLFPFFICCKPKPYFHLSFFANGNALTAIWFSATQGSCGAGL